MAKKHNKYIFHRVVVYYFLFCAMDMDAPRMYRRPLERTSTYTFESICVYSPTHGNKECLVYRRLDEYAKEIQKEYLEDASEKCEEMFPNKTN